jgi:O-6-methylguanine DNA methyltransferase
MSGELAAIDGILVETGGTVFQRSVWAALRKIPVGHTLSYGALASRLRCPKAVRAVGLANGANPVGVVVPCHRIIGSDGTLTGYGGGVHRICLGHQLARIERWPKLELAVDESQIKWRKRPGLKAIEHLPVATPWPVPAHLGKSAPQYSS